LLAFFSEFEEELDGYSSMKYNLYKLVLMKNNPNWRAELKEEYKNNFKKILILGIIPIFLLMWGFVNVIDELSAIKHPQYGVFQGRYTTDLIVNYFQLLMLHIIIPIYIYNPLNPKICSTNGNYDIVYSEILTRYNVGGNLLFFSSFISILIKFNGFKSEDYLTYVDIRCLVIPVCFGFVFFYNSFLKIKKKKT